MKSALNFLFSIDNERHIRACSNLKSALPVSNLSSLLMGDKRMPSSALKNVTPSLRVPSTSFVTGTRDIAIAKPPLSGATIFFSLPSISQMMRVTQKVASIALRRHAKRPYEESSSMIIPSELSGNPRATKRRRMESESTSGPSFSSSPPRGITQTASGSNSSEPPPVAAISPDAHRVGLEPHSIALWISELLNDKFSIQSNLASGGGSFLNEWYMKALCDHIITMLQAFNPSNNTIFAGLIYFERLMRNTTLRCPGDQKERLDLVNRTFLMSLNLAFVWLDDAPWTLGAIAEWMNMSLAEAKTWEIQALAILEYNLVISTDMWLYRLDALEAHANEITFQSNVAEAISTLFYNAREDVLETELAKERFFARIPPCAPAPPLVTPPSPKPEQYSRSLLTLAEELESHRAYTHTPYPDVISQFSDDPDSSESCYSCDSADGSPQAPAILTVPKARSTTLSHEAWDWHEEEVVHPVQQPHPIYPSYHYDLLSAAA